MCYDRANRMQISMLAVTHNRSHIVCQAIRDNFETMSGAPVTEIVWVDSGSTDQDFSDMQRMFRYVAETYGVHLVECRLNQNRGAAWSQNRAIALASGDAYLVSDCDMIFPIGVLRDAADALAVEPNRLAISVYHVPPDPNVNPERFVCPDNVTPWGSEWVETVSSGRTIRLRPGLAMVSKIFKREAVAKAGYVSESFGLVEHEDCEFAYRLRARCFETGCVSLVMMNAHSTHLPDVLGQHAREVEGADYWTLKEREFSDPAKVTRMLDLAGKGWPRFNPYP